MLFYLVVLFSFLQRDYCKFLYVSIPSPGHRLFYYWFYYCTVTAPMVASAKWRMRPYLVNDEQQHRPCVIMFLYEIQIFHQAFALFCFFLSEKLTQVPQKMIPNSLRDSISFYSQNIPFYKSLNPGLNSFTPILIQEIKFLLCASLLGILKNIIL